MKQLQRQAEEAISRGDFEESRRLDREIQALFPDADLSKPSPATQLTDFFESLVKSGLAPPLGGRSTEGQETSKCKRCGGNLKPTSQSNVRKCDRCGLNIMG